MPQAQPELKKVCLDIYLLADGPNNSANLHRPQYMEKRVFCELNGNRKVIGVLRGYDVRPNRPKSICYFFYLRVSVFRACDRSYMTPLPG